jgi:Domain of unknown function (DUF4126)
MPHVLIFAVGRVLAASLACGISLYGSLAIAGIAARIGFLDLPPGLNGLEQWLLIGAALALLSVEIVAAALPWIGSTWEALHTIVRPLGAALLVFVAVEPVPSFQRLALAALAALVAFAAHSAKIGLQLSAARHVRPVVLRAGELLVACGLILSALRSPRLSTALAAVVLGLLAIAGPRLWRASAFATLASIALFRAFFEPRHWRRVDDLPRRLRASLPSTEIGMPEPKVTRSALSGPAADWRNGWILFDGRSVRFLHTRRLRFAETRLPRIGESEIQHGFLADTIALGNDPAALILHIFKDGPPAETIVGALQLVVE